MEERENILKTFTAALVNEQVPKIYFNSFINLVGSSDVAISIQRNGASVGVLNLSYSTAKSLAIKLGEAISAFEATTGNKIMTVDEINKNRGNNDE